jgi:hypothetical protein
LKNIEIPHMTKVTRNERRGLLDFGLDGELLRALTATGRQGGTPWLAYSASEFRSTARPGNFHGQPEKTAKIEIAGGLSVPGYNTVKKEKAPRGACFHLCFVPRPGSDQIVSAGSISADRTVSRQS